MLFRAQFLINENNDHIPFFLGAHGKKIPTIAPG